MDTVLPPNFAPIWLFYFPTEVKDKKNSLNEGPLNTARLPSSYGTSLDYVQLD